jgi:hypothetical protein
MEKVKGYHWSKVRIAFGEQFIYRDGYVHNNGVFGIFQGNDKKLWTVILMHSGCAAGQVQWIPLDIALAIIDRLIDSGLLWDFSGYDYVWKQDEHVMKAYIDTMDAVDEFAKKSMALLPA